MLKRTAIKLFKEGSDITGVQDKPALGQAWCMYIDMRKLLMRMLMCMRMHNRGSPKIAQLAN